MLFTEHPGWESTIGKRVQSFLDKFPELKLKSLDIDSHNLLHLSFQSTDKELQNLGTILTYWYQRQAAITCQMCGEYGIRRKDLEGLPSLCYHHYIDRYNEVNDPNYISFINKE